MTKTKEEINKSYFTLPDGYEEPLTDYDYSVLKAGVVVAEVTGLPLAKLILVDPVDESIVSNTQTPFSAAIASVAYDNAFQRLPDDKMSETLKTECLEYTKLRQR